MNDHFPWVRPGEFVVWDVGFEVGGDAPRAEVVVLVECGGGFVLAIFVGVGAVLVSDEVLKFGFGFDAFVKSIVDGSLSCDLAG